jgi:hypothetical protein
MFKRDLREKELLEGHDDPTFSKTVKTKANPLGGLPLICTAIQLIREDQYARQFVAPNETEAAILGLYTRILNEREPGRVATPLDTQAP